MALSWDDLKFVLFCAIEKSAISCCFLGQENFNQRLNLAVPAGK